MTEDNADNYMGGIENNTNEVNTKENSTNEINTNENNTKENSTYEINTNEVKQSKESNTSEQQQNQNQNESKKMSTQSEEKNLNENKIIDGDSTLFKDQAVKDILDYNKKLKEDYDKLKESYEEEVKKSKQLSEKIKNLEKELSDEKKKNEDLTKELETARKNPPKENKNVEDNSTTENRDEFLQNILLKDKEISELKKKLDNSIVLLEGEELISIIFIYEEKHVHYSIICKNVDSLAIAEQKLFAKFPEMKDEDFDYYCNDTRLKRGFKFKEKNINNGTIITIKERD